MWRALKQYAKKFWMFLRGVVSDTIKLFRAEVLEKHRNIRKMRPVLAGRILKEEAASFFLGALKSFAKQALRYKGAHRSAALLDVFQTPYDNSFRDDGRISLLNSIFTCSRQVSTQALYDWRPSIFDRLSFNISTEQLGVLCS